MAPTNKKQTDLGSMTSAIPSELNSIKNECKNVINEINKIHLENEQFKFNQESNFLYHFVNKFTKVSIEDVREELKKLKQK